MKLIWSPRSRYDRELVFQRIGMDDLDAAERMDEKLNRLANGLVVFPQKGRPGRKAGTRELVAHPNYIIVYRIRGTQSKYQEFSTPPSAGRKPLPPRLASAIEGR